MNPKLRTFGVMVWSTVITVGFSATCLALYFKEIPITQRDFAMVLLGALISEMKGVSSFWTGSTVSSQAKDTAIAEIAQKQRTPNG